jgi:hypothetical protein
MFQAQIVDDIISAEEIAAFKQFRNEHQSEAWVDGYVSDRPEDVIDHRILIEPKHEVHKIIERVTRQFLPNATNIWANYQRQTNPHTLHIDDYAADFNVPTYTIIMALDDMPAGSAVLYQEEARSCAHLHEMIIEWCNGGRDANPRKNTWSETEDIEHTVEKFTGTYFGDWLTPDAVFRYKAGRGIFFKASQIHCSGNWRKYTNVNNKDLVQIHAH